MRYEIQKEYDLEKGMLLKVIFPEEEVDSKALYTIQNDMPDFLIPFKCKSVDNMMECTYYIGSDTKLQYRLGVRSKGEYIRCWKKILSPLLECRDWFLNAYSFVFDISQLYTDRDENYVRYLYIPSKTAASDFADLNSMVVDISRENVVEDTAMENTVLRSIMQNFSPKEFLMLLDRFELRESVSEESQAGSGENKESKDREPAQEPIEEKISERPRIFGQRKEEREFGFLEDLQIDFHEQESVAERESRSGFSGRSVQEKQPAEKPERAVYVRDKSVKERYEGEKTLQEKSIKEKSVKEKPSKGGIIGRFGFGKRKQTGSSQIMGAAAQYQPEEEKYNGYDAGKLYENDYNSAEESYGPEDSVTQLESVENGGPCLLYAGNRPNMPRRIEVSIPQRCGRFTIGRFDITVGKRQSDFEFQKNTMGVSRHHAVIERNNGKYLITDLQSSAGTYVNGTRLRANETVELTDNCRVSFGYDGAEYLWKE